MIDYDFMQLVEPDSENDLVDCPQCLGNGGCGFCDGGLEVTRADARRFQRERQDTKISNDDVSEGMP
jgi:hypothetical protein